MSVGFDALDHQDVPIVVPGPDPRALEISGGTSGAGVSMSNVLGSGTMVSGSTVSGWE
jgi:hypothetical protein